MNLKTTIYITLSALLLIGCQPKTISQSSLVKNSKVSSSQQQKVKQAFDNADALQVSHSKWFARTEKLPLTIIATAYIEPKTLNTKEYKAYKILVKKIEKDPSILGAEIASKYSSIKFIDYNSNGQAQKKFNVAYTNRYNDKTILTDSLRPDIEKPSQELLIRLNYKELKKGNLTIEGYKTVKQKDKNRNSYYYTLRKINYSKLSKKYKNKAIVNSLKATLSLSIPQYVSIDRKELVKDGEVLRFITPNEDGSYTGKVFKYETNDSVRKLEDKIVKLKNEIVPIEKDINSEHKPKVLKGHTKGVNSVAISPDGKYALSGEGEYKGKSFTLRYWDLKTGETLKVFKGHKNGVSSVVISPDGRYALSGSDDETLRYGYLALSQMNADY